MTSCTVSMTYTTSETLRIKNVLLPTRSSPLHVAVPALPPRTTALNPPSATAQLPPAAVPPLATVPAPLATDTTPGGAKVTMVTDPGPEDTPDRLGGRYREGETMSIVPYTV